MRYTILFFALASTIFLKAQLNISQYNTKYCIDFDQTVSGINTDTFSGTGFQSTPESGQLNSHGIFINGLSDGDMSASNTGTYITTDYARGISSGGVTTGGIYAFKVSDKNVALGFQSTGSDMTPGEIICICCNKTGKTITQIELSFDFLYFNDQERSSYLVFSFSSDNNSYTTIDNTLKSTPVEQDIAPSWKSTNISTSFSVNIPANDSIFLKWTTDDSEGSGSRDEIALDNIQIKAFSNTTSISQNKNLSTVVYPNPFKDFINIKSADKILSVQLYNSLGQCIVSKSQILLNSFTIETTNLKSGIYILNTKLQSGKMTFQKIMKE